VEKIEHFIVLMMENRSFDHLLGYLDHPDPTYAGVGRRANNPTTRNARYAIYPGPDHSHRGVLEQMLGTTDLPSYPNDRYQATMGGFAANYERLAPGRGNKVMRCFDPQMVPVISTLAREFAVCDHWFCSVPGETWPNRDFLHAGTSFGHVDIHRAPIWSNPPTIFRLLDTVRRRWRIYHEGIAQIFLYSQLFTASDRRGNHRQLIADIQGDRLPAYAFVEPDYGLPGAGNSQHPSQASSREEFVNGEQFIANIYNALRATPAVFAKTAFILTYDEHGGFYDHVAPPRALQPDTRVHEDGTYKFGFRILGPRVPAVVVSPWIEAGTVDHTERDHSCVGETIRKRFLANVTPPLNDRAEGADLGRLFTRSRARTTAEMPAIRALTQTEARDLEARLSAEPDDSDLHPAIDGRLQSAMGDLRNALAARGVVL
jgi:phospholipase C